MNIMAAFLMMGAQLLLEKKTSNTFPAAFYEIKTVQLQICKSLIQEIHLVVS